MFHQSGIFVTNVIITQQMQHCMNDQVRGMVGERFSPLAGLARAGFPGDGDVSELGIAGLGRLGPRAGDLGGALFGGP